MKSVFTFTKLRFLFAYSCLFRSHSRGNCFAFVQRVAIEFTTKFVKFCMQLFLVFECVCVLLLLLSVLVSVCCCMCDVYLL